MIFVDSNVIIDILEEDERWFAWSFSKLRDAVEDGRAVTNLIVFAECASRFPKVEDQIASFDTLGLTLKDMDEATAFTAGTAYRRYRRAGAERLALLPDFMIGAHALSLGAEMLTRDRRIYERYFPELSLITPEDQNG